MKKILLLGGSAQQVIAIETAKRLGYFTILCDYLTDNPGQYSADRFYLVSTTDKESVLEVALKEQVDGILAYASDPAAPTAAYVAEKMGLPGNPYSSVEILCNKDQFRAFLKEHHFHTPEAQGYSSTKEALADIRSGRFRMPLIVKPVDSSGSKGVSRIDRPDEAAEKLNYAMDFSRQKRIIVEEYVDCFGYQLAGDGLSVDGKLVFRCFANDHFDPRCVNPFVPVSASFPYNMPEDIQNRIHDEIQRLLSLLNMKTCTYNFDMRIDRDFHVYLMEIAPRSGGNYIPQIIRYATGVDLIECAVKAAMGEPLDLSGFSPEKMKAGTNAPSSVPAADAVSQPEPSPKHTDIMPDASGYYAYYAVHSYTDGILKRIEISEEASKHILENHLIARPGDEIRAFSGANTTLGILLMKFDSMEEMLEMMDHSDKWIRVHLES